MIKEKREKKKTVQTKRGGLLQEKVDEIRDPDPSIIDHRKFTQEFPDLGGQDTFPEIREDIPDISDMHRSVTVLVEGLEGFLQHRACRGLLSDQSRLGCEELFETDPIGFREAAFSEDVDVLLRRCESETPNDQGEFVQGHIPVTVLVEHRERLSIQFTFLCVHSPLSHGRKKRKREEKKNQ